MLSAGTVQDESGMKAARRPAPNLIRLSRSSEENVRVLGGKKVALLSVLQIMARTVVRFSSNQMYKSIHVFFNLKN